MRKRLTRGEIREQTRLRLIDAAALIIARKGLAATSVEDIATQAGYTRGAFYSNFSSKGDLFTELLRLDHQRVQDNLRKLVDAAPPRGDLMGCFALLCTTLCHDNNHYVIWTEARLQATRDAEFRRHISALYLEKRNVIAHVAEHLVQRTHAKPQGHPSDHALSVVAWIDGILYFTMTMPNEFSSASAEVVLSDIFAMMFHAPLS